MATVNNVYIFALLLINIISFFFILPHTFNDHIIRIFLSTCPPSGHVDERFQNKKIHLATEFFSISTPNSKMFAIFSEQIIIFDKFFPETVPRPFNNRIRIERFQFFQSSSLFQVVDSTSAFVFTQFSDSLLHDCKLTRILIQNIDAYSDSKIKKQTKKTKDGNQIK